MFLWPCFSLVRGHITLVEGNMQGLMRQQRGDEAEDTVRVRKGINRDNLKRSRSGIGQHLS